MNVTAQNATIDDSIRQPQILVSADSHVTEPTSVWEGLLDPSFWRSNASRERTRGTNPKTRASEVARDGVVAEVLYPTLGLALFAIDDVDRHEAACHAYNEWLARYCSADPDRLLGVGLIPCYRPEVAIAEIRWCHAAGLRGVMVWQSPHPDLPFTSAHYDPIWSVAQELHLPLSVHILTGFNYSQHINGPGEVSDLTRRINHYRGSVNEKLACAVDTLFSFIFSGVLERFPELKLVVVENEVAWLPFVLDQWDYYYRRFAEVDPVPMTKAPSAYFDEQVFVTFFRDPWVGRLLPTWGRRNLMWSNDYPHPNSTWPNSQRYVEEQLSGVDRDAIDRVLRDNCIDLYDIATEVLERATAPT